MISLHKFARLAPHYLIDQSVAVAAALWENSASSGVRQKLIQRLRKLILLSTFLMPSTIQVSMFTRSIWV
jgi:hypothetical protein